MLKTIDKPIPVPNSFEVKKGSNMRLISLLEIPIPLSLMSI